MMFQPIAPVGGTATGRPTPTWCDAEVVVNRQHTDRYRHLRLVAPRIAELARPGQFVMLTVSTQRSTGPVLPRPMAIYTRDAACGVIDIRYAVLGEGTRSLSEFVPGEQMVVVGPLGQGFVIHHSTARLLLVGRGIGTCSLTGVAQDLVHEPLELFALTSGREPGAVIGADLFRECGAAGVWAVNDADGSSEVDELRTRLRDELDDRPPQQILTCGSQRLTRLSVELGTRWEAAVQVSLEAHMACGLGYCHGCATGDFSDPREAPLICRDGPVFTVAG